MSTTAKILHVPNMNVTLTTFLRHLEGSKRLEIGFSTMLGDYNLEPFFISFLFAQNIVIA